MRLVRLAFSQQLVLVNICLLAIAGACEAQNRQQAESPGREAAAQATQPPAAPQGTGGAGVQRASPSPQGPESIAELVEAVKGTVVNVEVQSRTPAGGFHGGQGFPDDLFEHFFGSPEGPGPSFPQERILQGQGSGFIIDPSGLVLTNNHVVENALDIRVKLDDGRAFDAKVLGSDPLTDLALLKLQGDVKNLPVARLGDSDAVRVGDWVVAIGNPFGLASSVSAGILSARARDIQAGPFDNFLQTDAAINPGNSGGPLFNMRGEVIGISTAIVGGGTGIGFALPSNMARALLPQLQKGEIRRGWLGVSVQDLTPELAQALGVSAREGAIVTDVQKDTPAARAGLKPDDVIIAIDGEPIETSGGLTRNIGFRPPGETVRLTLLREGRQQQLQVKLGERPDLEGVRAPTPEREEETGRKLGLRLQDVDPRMMPGAPEGALITLVDPGSPADRAGLMPGMVIVEAGGKPVRNPRDFAQIIRGARSGSVLLLRIQVDGGRVLRALTVP
jgi:serine protease Do